MFQAQAQGILLLSTIRTRLNHTYKIYSLLHLLNSRFYIVFFLQRQGCHASLLRFKTPRMSSNGR